MYMYSTHQQHEGKITMDTKRKISTQWVVGTPNSKRGVMVLLHEIWTPSINKPWMSIGGPFLTGVQILHNYHEIWTPHSNFINDV